MAENKNHETAPQQQPVPNPGKERVGEILRSERERRGISIFVIAKDLRLNPRFLEAIEIDDYDQLPGDAYIRVYLRSLSRYFSLNADELLEKFFKERGLSGVDTLRKDSRTKINIAALREKEKPNKTVILTALLLIILAFLLYIATRQQWFSADTTPPVPVVADSTSPQNERSDPEGVAVEDSERFKPGTPDLDTSDFENAAVFTNVKSEKNAPADAENPAAPAKDSLNPARRAIVKDSIQKADAKARIVKDSIQKADAKARIVKDSIQKADAKARIVKDSILKADAKARIIKDSILKADAKNKTLKDSILKADEKSRIALAEIQKAQAQAGIIKDSMVKAEARKKAVRDSVLKADAKSKSAGKDSLKTKVDTSPAPVYSQIMELKLEVTGKSAWIRLLIDGAPWRNIMRQGFIKTFSAKDSFNLRTGQLEDLVLTLNGKKLTLPSNGIIALKIDRSGPVVWADEQWFKMTKGRF